MVVCASELLWIGYTSFFPIPSVIWRKVHLSDWRIVELLLPSMCEKEWLISFWMMSTLEDFFQAFIRSNPYHFYTKKKRNRKKISVCYWNSLWFSVPFVLLFCIVSKTNNYYKFDRKKFSYDSYLQQNRYCWV